MLTSLYYRHRLGLRGMEDEKTGVQFMDYIAMVHGLYSYGSWIIQPWFMDYIAMVHGLYSHGSWII